MRRFILTIILFATFAGGGAWAQSLVPAPRSQSPDGNQDPRSRLGKLPDYRKYEYGREVYQVKLGCNTCPLGETKLTEEVAERFYYDDSLWVDLKEGEFEAVSEYLKQLFPRLAAYGS